MLRRFPILERRVGVWAGWKAGEVEPLGVNLSSYYQGRDNCHIVPRFLSKREQECTSEPYSSYEGRHIGVGNCSLGLV